MFKDEIVSKPVHYRMCKLLNRLPLLLDIDATLIIIDDMCRGWVIGLPAFEAVQGA